MAKVLETKNVPDDQVEAVVDDYRAAGATAVEKVRQDDGKWTVRATFPD